MLTDHSGHSVENSIYEIVREMQRHERCELIDVASRGLAINDAFFDLMQQDGLVGHRVTSDFHYATALKYFASNGRNLKILDYDLVLLRLPRPISDEFLKWLSDIFAHTCVVNDPLGIIATSNKKFLTNFPDICPNVRLCRSIKEINEERQSYPIVLKPLRAYGGKGLLKIEGDVLDDGIEKVNAQEFLRSIEQEIETDGYLSMRYLKNVHQGDKRILVVGGEIMAATLRLPAKGSWLCNVSRGGRSVASVVTDDEIEIVNEVDQAVSKEGILMYGVDTLVNDDGVRVLSEINTLSVGGWPQAQKQSQKPIIKKAINKIFSYADVVR